MAEAVHSLPRTQKAYHLSRPEAWELGATASANLWHPSAIVGEIGLSPSCPSLILTLTLEVWPESHWPGFTLRQSDVFQSYAAQ